MGTPKHTHIKTVCRSVSPLTPSASSSSAVIVPIVSQTYNYYSSRLGAPTRNHQIILALSIAAAVDVAGNDDDHHHYPQTELSLQSTLVLSWLQHPPSSVFTVTSNFHLTASSTRFHQIPFKGGNTRLPVSYYPPHFSDQQFDQSTDCH